MRRTVCFALLVAALALLATREVQARPQGKYALKDCLHDTAGCTSDSQVICGIDEKGTFKTFKNKCEMEATNCYESKYYSFFMDDQCL